MLNPKWKGKILSYDPSQITVGALVLFFYHHPKLGPEFMKRLFGGMNVTFSRDFRQLTDWLATGKFALCFSCRGVQRATRLGLPVDALRGLREGPYLTVGGATLSQPDRTRNPNAAKVFINWFLSRKGQIALQKIGRPLEPPNSLRIDTTGRREIGSNATTPVQNRGDRRLGLACHY